MTETSPRSRVRSDRTTLLVGVMVAGVMAVASLAMLALVRASGVRLTGDEPAYLVAALSFGHVHSLSVDAAYLDAISHHLFTHWGPPPLEPLIDGHLRGLGAHPGTQVITHDRRHYPVHEIGLPILLSPVFVFTKALWCVQIWYAILFGAGATVIAGLVGSIAGVRSPWRFATAALFASPAILVASTQLYPDLPSGMTLAIAVLLVARVEVTGVLDRIDTVGIGASLAVLPWLHATNYVPTAMLGVALLAVMRRRAIPMARLRLPTVMVLGSGVLLAAWNATLFGSVFGRPDAHVSFSAQAAAQVADLFVDRQAGLLVQVPIVVLGIAAIWTRRRSLRVTTTVATLIVLEVLITSGDVIVGLGGTSLVGRFTWTVAPVLLGFAALAILDMAAHRRRVLPGVVGAIAVLDVLQMVPLLRGTHDYFSYLSLGPAAPVAGWWWGIDRLLPSFAALGGTWRQPVAWLLIVTTTTFVVLLVTLVVTLLGDQKHAVSEGTRFRRPGVGLAGLLLAALVVVATVLGPQPVGPLRWSGSSLAWSTGHKTHGSLVVHGVAQRGPVIVGPGVWVPTGRYVITIDYRLVDSSLRAAPFEVLQESPTRGAETIVVSSSLRPSPSGHQRVVTHLDGGHPVTLRIFWEGTGTLVVHSIELVELGD